LYLNTNISVLPSVDVNVGAVDPANSNIVLNAIVCEPL
jgi:hypothetical protein